MATVAAWASALPQLPTISARTSVIRVRGARGAWPSASWGCARARSGRNRCLARCIRSWCRCRPRTHRAEACASQGRAAPRGSYECPGRGRPPATARRRSRGWRCGRARLVRVRVGVRVRLGVRVG
eukprot:scaffold110652_cov72-Phaeocystis_antarctica.AAC.1